MEQVIVVSALVAGLTGVAVLGSYGFAWYSWRRTTHPVSGRFALLMAADGSWALFAFLGMVSPSDELALLWRTPLAISATIAAFAWFLFVVAYTGDEQWLPDVTEQALVAQGLLYSLLYVVNPGELVYSNQGVAQYGLIRLPYDNFGPVIIGQLILVYLLLGLTFFLLGRFFLRTRNLYRKQTAVIFIVTFLIVLASVAFFAGLTPHPRLDLTPVFFSVQAVGVGAALYRYDFLDSVPMAANRLFEEMSDPVFIVDSDKRLLDWNGAANRYVPNIQNPTLSSVADDNSMVWSASIEGLDTAIVTDESGTTVKTPEVTTNINQDGTYHPVTYDIRTTDITDRYGIVRGAIVVLRDVSEREEQKRALESQNERLEEFTGIVSHDLRNPLQIIDGKIRLACETEDLSHLDDAADAVERMERMLDDLLRLAKEGQTIEEKAPVSLDACCRDVWGRLDAPSATLRVETDAEIIADADRLQQVFENLFRNALDHAGPSVTITVGEFEDGIYVADDGPGVPEDERDEVFEFGTTNAEDGTGIGLAIVDRIVDAHNWDIDITESEHGGARFEITPLQSGLLKS